MLSREISLMAVLVTLSAAGRTTSGVILCIQPAMFLVVITGAVFGARTGFLVGSMTPLVANFFLGQGPWTIWQMVAWGLIGASAGWLKSNYPCLNNKMLMVFTVIWGCLYGWIMNIWYWTAFIYPLTWQSFFTTCAASFWFDTCRAIGNGIFFSLLGSGIIKILTRFRKKMRVSTISV